MRTARVLGACAAVGGVALPAAVRRLAAPARVPVPPRGASSSHGWLSWEWPSWRPAAARRTFPGCNPSTGEDPQGREARHTAGALLPYVALVSAMAARKAARLAVLLAALGLCTATTPAPAAEFIVVQSTTSTRNSGLLDHLLPQFTAGSGIEVRVVAVGTGQAIRNARNGDADVLLVHAKPAEEAFVADGFGVERFDLMYNDFVIVGPAADPAGVAGMDDAASSLGKIARARAAFASRGDDSGTHRKEMELWRKVGLDPVAASGGWYRETGSGMGATLNTAVGMNAYALTDRATWIAFGNKGDFTIHVERDARLFNQYGLILVNPEKHPHVKARAGLAFIDWMLGPEGQSAIASFEIAGQQLFFPNASRGASGKP